MQQAGHFYFGMATLNGRGTKCQLKNIKRVSQVHFSASLFPCTFKILTRALSAATVSKLRVSHIAVHICTMYIPSDIYLGKSINRKSRDYREPSLYHIVLETRYVLGSRCILSTRERRWDEHCCFLHPSIHPFVLFRFRSTDHMAQLHSGRKKKQKQKRYRRQKEPSIKKRWIF